MITNGDDQIAVVPVRHYGRLVGALIALVAVAMLIHTLFSRVVAPSGKGTVWRFSWDVVHQYFFTSEIFQGLYRTILLTIISMAIGISLGIIVAIMRLSPSRLVSATAWSYTWFFRGTPVYVQLLFWFNIAALYPQITIGLPFMHVTFLTLNANSITPFIAGFLALGLNEAAYMSEIARSGIISVDEGQIEAASSIGMTRGQTLRLVVIPQAMRVIIPPTGNEVISMLKTSSLAAAIGVTELTGTAQNIYSANYKVMALLIVISLWYLAITTLLSIGQFYVERHFAKGALRTPPPTPIERLKGDIRGIAGKFVSKRPAKEVSR